MSVPRSKFRTLVAPVADRRPAKRRSRTSGLYAEALERCHARWANLFFGLWSFVRRRDPKTDRAIREALVAAGLMGKDRLQPIDGLFDPDPRPSIVRLTEHWR